MGRNLPWEESWYDKRARENNPLRNDIIVIGSDLESSVNDASIGINYSNTSFMRHAGIGSSLLLAAYMMLITACGGQAAPISSPTSSSQRAISTPITRQETSAPQPTLEARVGATVIPSAVSTQQVVKNGVVIQYNQTDSKGIATFEDSTTGQTVTVEVVDASSKPLHGMRVQYLDSTDFEGFVVEDPNNHYATLFKVYPHNTIPPITTHVPAPNLHIPLTMRTSGPAIREVNNSSDEGQALDNLVKHTKNEWLYLGRRTPDQLDAEDKIYSFILGLAGIDTSVVSDIAGKIADISDSISGWHEPEFYDVYEIIPTNPITTSIRVLVPVKGKPVITPTTTQPQTPVIRDGSKIAFAADGKIYLANISTKEVFPLTPPSQQQSELERPDLSPDGKLMVYSSVRVLTSRKGIESDNLWLMDIGTGRIAKLTAHIADSPSWSNDGRKIVFMQGLNIYTVDLSQDCRLKVADTYLFPSSQSFSPDNSRILYNRGFSLNQSTGSIDRMLGPWIVNSDGSYNSRFISLEATNPGSYQVLYELDWSIAGKIAAVINEINESQNQRYWGIVLMDGDGSNLKRLTWSNLGITSGYFNLRWSQDGEYLFYKQYTLGTTPNLLVIDPKSGDTLDIRTFKWHKTDTSAKEVSLGEFLGKEKKPYSEECFGPSTEGISTFEMKHQFDGDRSIELRVMYDNKIAAESMKREWQAKFMKLGYQEAPAMPSSLTTENFISDSLTKEIIDRPVQVSSTDLGLNSNIFIDLESELLKSFRELGVVNVDIRYIRIGAIKYVN